MKKLLLILATISFVSFADQEIVIKAHSRSAELNAKHQVECAKMGGVDVTDDSDTTIGSKTTDAVFCVIPEDQIGNGHNGSRAGTFNPDGTENEIHSTPNLKQDYSEEYPLSDLLNSNYPTPTYRPQAVNVRIPMYQAWWLQGAVFYTNLLQAKVLGKINVPDFGCSATKGFPMITNTKYELDVRANCVASQGRLSTQDIMAGCLNNSCMNATGTINFY